MSEKQLIVINIVGMTPALLGSHTPNLNALMEHNGVQAMTAVFPAVTTTAQASMLTGKYPQEHGVVGNGWYFRDLAEVRFWLQSNHLVQGEKIWRCIKHQQPDFRCSTLFWWYNMYSGVDHSITPRPHYPADGRKVMGLYSEPADLHAAIERKIGVFPFYHFWGPAADIRASRWIVDAAMEEFRLNRPHLQFVYLPHLDYNLQRLGPDDPAILEDVQAIDHEAGRLIAFVRAQGAEVTVVSEYGVSAVNQSVSLNRVLREAGYLRVRESLTWELLDCGASRAFAVADHQIAHLYIRDPADVNKVKRLVEAIPGVEQVLAEEEKKHWRIDHPRCGELLVIAQDGCWFDYYYWLDDRRAPDFATTVDIHRKPGYDPLELFIDPAIRFPKLKILTRLAQKKIGQRMLMDVIPLDTSLVKGSHGRLQAEPEHGPIYLSTIASGEKRVQHSVDVFDNIKHYFT